MASDQLHMLESLLKLGSPDLLEATSITDPPGAGCYFSASTVLRLLKEQRETIIRAIEALPLQDGRVEKLAVLRAVRAA